MRARVPARFDVGDSSRLDNNVLRMVMLTQFHVQQLRIWVVATSGTPAARVTPITRHTHPPNAQLIASPGGAGPLHTLTHTVLHTHHLNPPLLHTARSPITPQQTRTFVVATSGTHDTPIGRAILSPSARLMASPG